MADDDEEGVTLEYDLSRLPSRPPPRGIEKARLNKERWSLEQLEAYLEAHPEEVYAVLDGCVGRVVWDKVDELVDLDKRLDPKAASRVASLFNGHAAHKYAEVAPYLVRVDAPLLRWIWEELRSKRWGLFLLSGEPFLPLRGHLHSLLMAQNEGGKALYFRFYDGEVLTTMLAASSQEEAQQIFGEAIERFVITEENSHLTVISLV